MNEPTMTPEHTALIARLEGDVTLGDVNAAIAALREQAGEIERLKRHYKGVPHDWVAESLHDEVMEANAGLTTERDTLRGDNENHKRAVLALTAEVAALAKERDHWAANWHRTRAELAELKWPGMKGVIKPMTTETVLDDLEQELSRAADGVETSLEWRALNELRALRELRIENERLGAALSELCMLVERYVFANADEPAPAVADLWAGAAKAAAVMIKKEEPHEPIHD